MNQFYTICATMDNNCSTCEQSGLDNTTQGLADFQSRASYPWACTCSAAVSL